MSNTITSTLGDSLEDMLGGRSSTTRTQRIGHIADQALAEKLDQPEGRVEPETELKNHFTKITREGFAPTLFGSLAQTPPEPTGRSPDVEKPSRPNSGTLLNLFG